MFDYKKNGRAYFLHFSCFHKMIIKSNEKVSLL